jgi:hypothetical protein
VLTRSLKRGPPAADPTSVSSLAPPVAGTPCEACGETFDLRAPSCPRCGFPRAGAAAQVARPASKKSPREAMWLSLVWPGGGHLYAGDPDKCAILTSAALVCLLLSAAVIGPVLGLLVWLGLALYGAIDSGRAVDARNERLR